MRFTEARFVGAFLDLPHCPNDRPGILFSGRSNVGKSTVLNRFAGRTLARTSRTPGRTRQLIYYAMRAEKLPPFYLVDLPGYGYASGARSEREKFARAVRSLLAAPDRIAAILQLVDVSVPWQDPDLEMLEWLLEGDIPFALVFTKADRVNNAGPARRLAELVKLLPWREEIPVLPTSGRENEGIVGVRKFVGRVLQRPPGSATWDFMPGGKPSAAEDDGSSTSV
ncbi:MAG: ribosome biogenesis GTP-binding protein YihA/YsxC [Candidatus Eiseniibacteriota bacterium]